LNPGKRNKEFKDGYDAAVKDFKDENNLELFKEGYKAGFRDGYMAVMMEIKDQMPADFKEKMGDDVQPWIWPW